MAPVQSYMDQVLQVGFEARLCHPARDKLHWAFNHLSIVLHLYSLHFWHSGPCLVGKMCLVLLYTSALLNHVFLLKSFKCSYTHKAYWHVNGENKGIGSLMTKLKCLYALHSWVPGYFMGTTQDAHPPVPAVPSGTAAALTSCLQVAGSLLCDTRSSAMGSTDLLRNPISMPSQLQESMSAATQVWAHFGCSHTALASPYALMLPQEEPVPAPPLNSFLHLLPSFWLLPPLLRPCCPVQLSETFLWLSDSAEALFKGECIIYMYKVY